MGNKEESNSLRRLPRACGRFIAGATSSTLLAGACVVVTSHPAFAADPFPVTKLYGTAWDSNFQGVREIYEIDKDTGQTTQVIVAPASAGGTVLNQIGVSRGGGKIMLTNRSTVYEYTAATETWEETARGDDGVPGTMGGVNPSNDWLYYGGQVEGETFRFAGYNPDTNTVVGSVLTATLPGSPGNNGDLAFDRQGNMFAVVGGGSEAQIYRVDGPMPTASGGTATGTPVGSRIPDVNSLNSMAFGDDGYLYLYANNGFLKVDPSTGAVVRRGELSGPVQRLTDLASWATPSTAELEVDLPQGRAKDGDQFGVSLTGGGITTGNTGETTGNETGTQDQESGEHVGPLIGLPGKTYTITQTAAGTTDLADYNTTWKCVDLNDGNKVIASGEGNSGEFTMPDGADSSSISCAFTNVPKPVATDDESLNNEPGSTVKVPVLGNDKGDLDPSTVRIVDPKSGDPVSELKVPGEGTWTVDPSTGDITFVPEDGFTGNPTPIDYQVADKAGNETKAKVTVTYKPEATDDESLNNEPGSTVKVPVLGNDKGDLDPSTVRIVDPKSGDPVSELKVPGEGTWTVDPSTGDITFVPEDGFTGNPTPVDYQVADKAGNETKAKVTVTYKPEATDDESLNNEPGSTVKVPVLGNDKGDLDPSTVRIVDPKSGDPVSELKVPGEGTWTVDPSTGDITFVPEDGFTGNPTPIDYQVADKAGNETKAKVTVTYKPEATDDESLNNEPGTAVKVPVLGNDKGDLDPTSVRIVDPKSGDPVNELKVPGEGTWTVDPNTGDITFTPEDGFTGNPTPIDYQVSDKAGNETKAKVTVTYKPEATDDESLNNEPGTAVKVPVLGNDKGDLDPSTVRVVDPKTGKPVSELKVPGEGVWTVDPKTGDITFTPDETFGGNPTPIDYRVSDKAGNETTAKTTVTYKPGAADDKSLDNKLGSTVKVPVLGNDHGDLDPTSVRIVDPKSGDPVNELKVPGEGTWTVDPNTGDITFTPEKGFGGNPTPIDYQVSDKAGNETTATVTVTYKPEAGSDKSLNNAPGNAVTVPVLGDDNGDLDPSSVRIIDPKTGKPVRELKVPGQGVWKVDPNTGNITFTPKKGYLGNPTPITYQVTDRAGKTARARVTITYKAPTSTIRIKKTDAKNGAPLGGAVFELWRESNGVRGLQTSGKKKDTRMGASCATNKKGACTFGRLPLGSYYLKETDVPDGYVLPKKSVTGPYVLKRENASKGVTATLTNRRGDLSKGK
ncbi:Ig-like domain-containing protein [Streptomyces sp. NPDC050504]|uniref:Ig-like domain-containing protein n=1 Tax=Streptomyces sp. NPDC050504 TaxID=3365618 RepID=UPI00379A4D24